MAAGQEERFSRRKHDHAFPHQAVDFCLRQAGCQLSQLDRVVVCCPPDLVTDPLLSHLDAAFDPQRQLGFAEHHASHVASAFYPSPYRHAAILTLDGGWDGIVSSLACGVDDRITMLAEWGFPQSLGAFYSAITGYCGFKVGSGEYKMMGLAPYGQPHLVQTLLNRVIQVCDDGLFRLNPDYFRPEAGFAQISACLEQIFGVPARRAQDPLTAFHMDLAASAQRVAEQIILGLARRLRRDSGMTSLCLAGSMALNCVANGKLLRAGIFDSLWIQPAAGDAGCALGAALSEYHRLGNPRANPIGDGMAGSYLGPDWPQQEVERQLDALGARYTVLNDDDVIAATAQALATGKAMGWMQGRMEFGPRALGNRSILADPRSPHMQKTLNLKIKFRESFRPFAPSVLAEDAADWFDLAPESPYMLLVAPLHSSRRQPMSDEEQVLFGIDKLNICRSAVPAITHVDYSARIQTVRAEVNPRYHALLTAFKQLTGCGMLVNTSFNIRGEPIVCQPADAFRCFMGNELDGLVIGNCLLWKDDQDPALLCSTQDCFEPD